MNLPDFLRHEFDNWQDNEARTMTDFAIYLGVGQANLSRWISGKSTPDGKSLARLASKLGEEVYEAMGLVKPKDERLSLINKLWDRLPENLKQELADQASRGKARQGDREKNKAVRNKG